MTASISLGRWFGVPVGLHYSWFIIAWLITLSLTGPFALLHPAWSTETVWALSLVTSALFFVCILLHELAHALGAQVSGVRVQGITLFALGGITHLEKDAASPSREFGIAIAGPIASILIGLVCRTVASTAGHISIAVAAVFGWLAYINIALALFNLIPGFPLDGGHVLRAIIWAGTHRVDRATRIAARVGQAVGGLFIAVGLFHVFTRGDFGGLWIAFIGWFLLEGAQATYLQARRSRGLRDVRVADVMARDCATVDAHTTLRRFVDDQLLRIAARCFAVSDDGRLLGLITPSDVKHVERDQWDDMTVSQAMRPIQTLHSINPDIPAGDALDVMDRENINQLPVVSDGQLKGVVTRSYLLNLLGHWRELEA
jgi:Zn-dependent protease/CBS domain-containing protein